MGRGRAKAKQTKVARQLKYSSGGTDLERLQQSLLPSGAVTRRARGGARESDDEDDDYEDADGEEDDE